MKLAGFAATTPNHERDLTESYHDMATALDNMPASHYNAWTNIGGGGMKIAIYELETSRARGYAKKVIILMTDGRANVDKWGRAGYQYEAGAKAYALEQAERAAGLEMKSAGHCREPKRQRIKFRCPLKTSKKAAQKYDRTCPANHPLFDTGKCYGCTKYIDITNDARARVPRDSKEYKQTFKTRQVVEQYYARLGDREVKQTTHYGFRTIQNQMTIAHLTASLIAVAAAVILKQPDIVLHNQNLSSTQQTPNSVAHFAEGFRHCTCWR